VLFFGAFYALLVVLPVYLDAARLDAASVAVVLGAFGVAGLVVRPLAGRWTDRFGPIAVVVGGIVVFAASTVSLLSAGSVAVLMLLRAGQAAGYVAFTTAATSMVALASDPAAHARVMARYGTAANVAMAGAPVATTALLDRFSPAGLVAGIALVAASSALFLPRGGKMPRPRSTPGAIARPDNTGLRIRRRDSVLAGVFGVGF
jgi:MFS family permease